MKSRTVLILVLICISVAACEKQWVKPGATAGQLSADIEACEQLAEEQFPVEMSSSGTSNRKEYTTRCTSHGNRTDCTTRSTDTGGASQHDRNLEKRTQAVNQCLAARGYRKQ